MGRDVLLPYGDRAQVRLSCRLYGEQVSYTYELKFKMKPKKSQDPMHTYTRVYTSGNLGANVDIKYYADTYTANGIKYSKWDVYEATLDLTLTYNGVTVEKDFLIRFE